MKVRTWVECSQEVDVEVTAEDMIAQLGDCADPELRGERLLRALNTSLVWLQKLPDVAIAELPPAPRKTLAEYLRKQAERFGR